jgi:hypothetical protein
VDTSVRVRLVVFASWDEALRNAAREVGLAVAP